LGSEMFELPQVAHCVESTVRKRMMSPVWVPRTRVGQVVGSGIFRRGSMVEAGDLWL
jgi:hypothetical protein